MKFLRLPVLSLLLLTVMAVSAQEADTNDEDEDGIYIESDWSIDISRYTRGDQTFCINLGLVKPLFFMDQNIGKLDTQMGLGGMGSLGYNYYLGPNFFLGGELSGMFSPTVGQNMFYMVPIGFRAGYQLLLSRFEFPLSLLVGFAPQSHNQRSYFGFFSKPTAGAFFRLNNEWSFGLNTSFWWVPQWTGKTREHSNYSGNVNIHGFFLEISAGVRYHF
ncbi:MAG: hypothetical protein LBH07_02970 [Treponema sp.]|nr:hypothetical protein [Treponema sp.]